MKTFIRSRVFLFLLLSACADRDEVRPGRGAEVEVGPTATIFPSGKEPREDRHGLWRGMEGERVVWEVRYTRGVPTGPYREWDASGNLRATWPYNWDGEIVGWARWYEAGEATTKYELTQESQPESDVIGKADAFESWSLEQQKMEAAAQTE